MKKIILLGLVIISLTSCDSIVYPAIDLYLKNQATDMDLYDNKDIYDDYIYNRKNNEKLSKEDFFEKYEYRYYKPSWIVQYCNSVIDFEDDFIDEWNEPEDIIKRGKGDCDDFAILFSNTAYFVLGEKWDIAVLDDTYKDERTVIEGGVPSHAICHLDGVLLDPQDAFIYTNTKIGYLYKFDEVFNN